MKIFEYIAQDGDRVERVKFVYNSMKGGQFSRVYLSDNNALIVCAGSCTDKMALSEAHHLRGEKHIPQVVYAGMTDDGKDCYISPRYSPLKAANKQAWADFKILQTVPIGRDYNDCYKTFVERYGDDEETWPDIIRSFMSLFSWMINYDTGYLTDIARFNVAVDPDGNLVFLDLFLIRS